MKSICLATLGTFLALSNFGWALEIVEGSIIDQTLDAKSKKVKRLEVSTGFTGYRSTLIFYTFNEQKAVLRVEIDNKSKEFPVSAKVYKFDDKTTPEAIKKWLNNQYSDGLFADAPRPVSQEKVPASACRVKSRKFINSSKEPFGKFENYKVEFQIVAMKKIGDFKLKSFSDQATVHLKAK